MFSSIILIRAHFQASPIGRVNSLLSVPGIGPAGKAKLQHARGGGSILYTTELVDKFWQFLDDYEPVPLSKTKLHVSGLALNRLNAAEQLFFQWLKHDKQITHSRHDVTQAISEKVQTLHIEIRNMHEE